jgi:hypothetical protein
MVLTLAENMAPAITQKPSVRREIRDEREDIALAAAAINGQEKRPRRIEYSKARNVRRTGIRSRDPRYY